MTDSTCRTCSWVVGTHTATTDISGTTTNAFPPDVARFDQMGDIWRCPDCKSVFRHEQDQDHDTHYPSTYEYLTRLSDDEAKEALASLNPSDWIRRA